MVVGKDFFFRYLGSVVKGIVEHVVYIKRKRIAPKNLIPASGKCYSSKVHHISITFFLKNLFLV
jgi:hypothetical protein